MPKHSFYTSGMWHLSKWNHTEDIEIAGAWASGWKQCANARFEASVTSHSFRHGLGMFGSLWLSLLPNWQDLHRNKGSLANRYRTPPNSTKSGAPSLFCKAGQTGCGSCSQASAGILSQPPKLSSFGFQGKRNSQRQPHEWVARHNTECSSSAAHLAQERRSTAAPSAPSVCAPKHLQNRENSVLLDVETSSQSENLTAKCDQTIWITQWKLVTTNRYIIGSRQSQFATVWSFSTSAKSQDHELKPIVQQHFPAKTPFKRCLFKVHPPGFSQLLPRVCWDLVAPIQVKILPASRQNKFSKTVTRRNTECSSSAVHLAKERRSTAAPSAPSVCAPKHLQNRENSVLLDVETSSQSENLTAKCDQTIWITQWKLVTTNRYIIGSRQSQFATVWSFSTSAKSQDHELKPIVQQHFPAKTHDKWCLFEVHPPGFSQLLPGICWDFPATFQVKILPVSRQKKFSKTVTRCHTSQLRMFLQRCAFGQGKEEHGGPICAHCVWIEAPSKQGELSLLLDVETSSQSETLTAKCTQTIWITQWKLVTTNWYHSEKSHEMQKIKTITTPCCLKLFNFGGSFLRTQASCNNIFLPRHPSNDAFLRFTHLASPSCFHASAGIPLQASKLRSFQFQDKRSSQRQSHGVTRHNSECSSSAAHLAKERRSTAAPLAPFVSRPKHLENIRGMKSDNRTSLAILYQRQSQKIPKTSFEKITWDAEDQGNHSSVLSEVSQLCQCNFQELKPGATTFSRQDTSEMMPFWGSPTWLLPAASTRLLGSWCKNPS